MKPTLRSFYLFSFFIASLTNLYAQDSAPPNMPMILDEIRTMKESLGENTMYEMPVCEFHLKEVLSRMMTHCPSSSSLLCECAKKLANGSLTLPLGDLLEIMPEVLKFAYESYEPTPEADQERAPRPGAPSATANDAVVGKNVCDLTQVLALLSMIKKRIQILQEIICRKFSETWTILEEIKEEIIDTRTILCDKFNGTFTMLEKIEEDIFDSTTILCDKFNGTFTMLEKIEEDIFDSTTILCDKFNGTFTMLEKIEEDIFDSTTILCDKFNGTFTTLDFICDKIESITATLSCFRDIPISTPTIITEPGSYCLINDIVGTITILADCVTLNLNNFKLLGPDQHIEITSANDVVVKNGSIQGSAGNAVQINDSINTELLAIDLVGNTNGVLIDTATCIKITDCSFRNHTNRALTATNIFNALICKNSFKLNTAPRVIEIIDGHNVIFDKNLVNNNTSTSSLTGIFASQTCNLSIVNSSINENVATGVLLGDDLNGLELIEVQNVKCVNCTIHKNISQQVLNGINISGGVSPSSDITIVKCEINQNVSQTNDVNGILGISIIKQVIRNTQANDNVGINFVRGFNLEGCTDTIYQQCFALTNSSVALNTSGFRSNSSIKTIYEECVANDNVGTFTGIGFELLNTNTSCVLNCIAKRNQGVNDIGRGIFLLDCFDNLVQENLAISNFGLLTGIGIEVSNTGGAGILSTGVFSNKSQAHVLNYRVSPGTILRVIYNRASFIVIPSAMPTNVDNLDII